MIDPDYVQNREHREDLEMLSKTCSPALASHAHTVLLAINEFWHRWRKVNYIITSNMADIRHVVFVLLVNLKELLM